MKRPAVIRLVLDEACTQAALVIPAEFPREQITVGYCEQLLREYEIEITPAVQAALQQLASQPPQADALATVVVARAVEPVHGTPGQLLWFVEPPKPQGDPQDQAVDFYGISPFIHVSKGQVIGRLVPPGAAQDGRDVKGRALAASAGQPVPFQFDASLTTDQQGQIVAQLDGVLLWHPPKASISAMLPVDGDVDFSTGNVNFNGEVAIRGGVSDRFTVECSGDLLVQGVIGKANIRTDANLIARGGISGDERSAVHVGHDLIARYLLNACADVRHDVRVEREVVNCSLTVGGRFWCPHGAIIGGALRCTGPVEVANLGSPADIATILELGNPIELKRLAQQLRSLMQRFIDAKFHALEQYKTLTLHGSTHLKQTRQKMLELAVQVRDAERQITRARDGLGRICRQARHAAIVDLLVTRRLHRAVQLHVTDRQYRVHQEVGGPVRIYLHNGNLVYRVASSPAQPINRIAELIKRVA